MGQGVAIRGRWELSEALEETLQVFVDKEMQCSADHHGEKHRHSLLCLTPSSRPC